MFAALTATRSRLLEQLFGGGAVRLGAVHVRFDPRDLGLERLDSGLQLLDRHGVEILLCKLNQRVAWLARKKILEVHGLNR
jgi:hypothetical protein